MARDYKSIGNATLESYKVAVIINGGSASASEIMAGALRDRRAVKLVGEKTFGKGSVQELIDFSDGSAAKITVAKWYTPSGSQINGEGLTPDIVVTDDAKTAQDDQLMAAFGVL
jgi:carboxyl-terminal processing protease